MNIVALSIVAVTCSVTYNGKFRYPLVWRYLKATIILWLICIMPSASHVNHFDKPNSNGLRSLYCSSSVRLYPDLSAGSFDLLLDRANRNSIFRHLLRYKVEHRQRMSQSHHEHSYVYAATKEIKTALSLLAKCDYNRYSNNKISERHRKII